MPGADQAAMAVGRHAIGPMTSGILRGVDETLNRLVAVARTDGNMVPPMVEAVRAEATLGEICDALRKEWGEYREPARF